MSNLTKRLYKIAKDKADMYNHVNMYDPGDKTTHRDFIEWEAAEELKRLQKRNALLENVAVAAERCIPDVGYIDDHDLDAMAAAVDKLREAGDG
jgi:hypothetical protein